MKNNERAHRGFSNKVSPTRKENRRGTGIGLRNVRELMEQAGGTAGINMEAGAFQITLCFPLPQPTSVSE